MRCCSVSNIVPSISVLEDPDLDRLRRYSMFIVLSYHSISTIIQAAKYESQAFELWNGDEASLPPRSRSYSFICRIRHVSQEPLITTTL